MSLSVGIKTAFFASNAQVRLIVETKIYYERIQEHTTGRWLKRRVMDGWIMLHRKSLGSRVWANPGLWHLWCYCLLRANHKPAWVTVTTGKGTTEVYVEAGQFIFGRNIAAKALGVSGATVYSRLQKLKKAGNINTQNRTHYSIVTVVNWQTYQSGENIKAAAVQHPNNRQSSTRQQPVNTNNNDKNVKNEKKYRGLKDNVLRISNTASQRPAGRQADDQNPYIR